MVTDFKSDFLSLRDDLILLHSLCECVDRAFADFERLSSCGDTVERSLRCQILSVLILETIKVSSDLVNESEELMINLTDC